MAGRGRPKGKLKTMRQSQCRDEAGVTAKQRKGIEAILTQTPGEKLTSIAERAGVSPRVIWDWFQKPHFREALRQATENTIGVRRPLVAAALLQGALMPGSPGFAACQRLYWELLGDIPGRITNGEGEEETGYESDKPNEAEQWVHSLPVEDQLIILEILERNETKQLESGQGTGEDNSQEVISPLPVYREGA